MKKQLYELPIDAKNKRPSFVEQTTMFYTIKDSILHRKAHINIP